MRLLKPMLAGTIDGSIVDFPFKYPIVVQPKIDGIRCLVQDNLVLSRSLKPIPNNHVRKILKDWFKDIDKTFIDGELVIARNSMMAGIQNNIAEYYDIESAIMSLHGTPSFYYMVFDSVNIDNYFNVNQHRQPFLARYDDLSKMEAFLLAEHNLPHNLHVVTSCHATSIEQLLAAMEHLTKTYGELEGFIFRQGFSAYKEGRSTIREQCLLKWKPMEDAEAEIVDIAAKEINTNPPIVNELGHQVRSSCKDGMVAIEALGSLTCKVVTGKFTGAFVSLGSGFTEQQREQLWLKRHSLIGKIVTFKYQKFGSKDEPRIPIFKGFRQDIETNDKSV